MKRITSQESKRFSKQKKSHNVSPISKQYLHQKENIFFGDSKEIPPYHQAKLSYFQSKRAKDESSRETCGKTVASVCAAKPQFYRNFAITSRNIERCQLNNHSGQDPPRSTYLVQRKNGKDFVCCDSCGKNYQNKKSILEMTSEMIGHSGITISEYCQKLQSNLNKFETMKQNAYEYRRNYHKFSDSEEQKYETYYASLIDVIHNTMRESKQLMIQKRNEGEEIFSELIETINHEIQLINDALGDVLGNEKKLAASQLIELFDTNPDYHAEIFLPLVWVNLNQ